MLFEGHPFECCLREIPMLFKVKLRIAVLTAQTIRGRARQGGKIKHYLQYVWRIFAAHFCPLYLAAQINSRQLH